MFFSPVIFFILEEFRAKVDQVIRSAKFEIASDEFREGKESRTVQGHNYDDVGRHYITHFI